MAVVLSPKINNKTAMYTRKIFQGIEDGVRGTKERKEGKIIRKLNM
jgi:hypothetical protein